MSLPLIGAIGLEKWSQRRSLIRPQPSHRDFSARRCQEPTRYLNFTEQITTQVGTFIFPSSSGRQTAMLDLGDDASRREKCYTTITQLPAYVDPKQPPTKKSPFSAILSLPYIHTVRENCFLCVCVCQSSNRSQTGRDYLTRSTLFEHWRVFKCQIAETAIC